MTKHTPEPWALCYSGSHIFIVDANYNVIASLDFDSKTKEANAALIAKTPEILAENAALQKRVAELEAERTRQPIETAPRDGSVTIVTDGNRIFLVKWLKNAKRWSQPNGEILPGMFTPTHFIPLPKMEDE